MSENPSYYSIIPATVRYDKRLTPNAKLLYAEITSLCNMNGVCSASNEYFANLYDVSKVSISKWINQLIEFGYINSEITYKDGSKQILNRYLSLVKDPIKEKFNTPIKEKFKDNINTSKEVYINKNLTDSNNINVVIEKLHEILKNYHGREFNTRGWEKNISSMIRLDKIDPERIIKSLDWYSRHIGEDYIPVIQSGKSLREKYNKLEWAIKRDESKNKPDDDYNPYVPEKRSW